MVSENNTVRYASRRSVTRASIGATKCHLAIAEAAIGIGLLLLLSALAHLYLEGRARNALLAFAAIKFLAYAAAAALTDDYAIAVYDSVATMVVVLGLGLRAGWMWHHPSGRWLVQ